MKAFKTIEYLKEGNVRQRRAYEVLKTFSVMEKLANYAPLLVGTVPIEIDVEGSDLDIICYQKDKNRFQDTIQSFSGMAGFQMEEKMVKGRDTVIIRFYLEEFPVEVFGQQQPTQDQDAYIHMINEYAILQKYGKAFQDEIIQLKRRGIKTEPAFARLLALPGDPYQALLDYKV